MMMTMVKSAPSRGIWINI